jgi:hypothetical protein
MNNDSQNNNHNDEQGNVEVTGGGGNQVEYGRGITQMQQVRLNNVNSNAPVQPVAGSNFSSILQELLAAHQQALNQQQPPPTQQDSENNDTINQPQQPQIMDTVPTLQLQSTDQSIATHYQNFAAAPSIAASYSNVFPVIPDINMSLVTPENLNLLNSMLYNNILGQYTPAMLMNNANFNTFPAVSQPQVTLTTSNLQPFQIDPGLLAYFLNQYPSQPIAVPSAPPSNPTFSQQPYYNDDDNNNNSHNDQRPSQQEAPWSSYEETSSEQQANSASMTSPTDPSSDNNIERLTGRPPIPLLTEYDVDALNQYQCLLREQIELFETVPAAGVEGRSQGRNTPIRIGQVGKHTCHDGRFPSSCHSKYQYHQQCYLLLLLLFYQAYVVDIVPLFQTNSVQRVPYIILRLLEVFIR